MGQVRRRPSHGLGRARCESLPFRNSTRLPRNRCGMERFRPPPRAPETRSSARGRGAVSAVAPVGSVEGGRSREGRGEGWPPRGLGVAAPRGGRRAPGKRRQGGSGVDGARPGGGPGARRGPGSIFSSFVERKYTQGEVRRWAGGAPCAREMRGDGDWLRGFCAGCRWHDICCLEGDCFWGFGSANGGAIAPGRHP